MNASKTSDLTAKFWRWFRECLPEIEDAATAFDYDWLRNELSPKVARLTRWSTPGRGFATLRAETRNQHGEVVQVMTARLMVPRRPG